jgi:2-haloacid dehalogenase
MQGGERAPLDYARFGVLTFDCYGTLIDWETGLVTALRRALPGLDDVGDEQLLTEYAGHEAAVEELPYRPYRQVLTESLQALAGSRGLAVDDDLGQEFGGSVRDWPAFADAPGSLRLLKSRYRLGVITNCDDDLFAASHERLGVELDWVVTAEQAGSYKPSARPFQVAFETIGVPRGAILHVAQSLFHDHVPAKALGLATVWIDRRHDREGFGATPPATATPDAVFPSLRAFADRAMADAD